MIKKIRHTGLVVHDLNSALDFWCDLLGFKVARQMEESGPHIDAMLDLKQARLTTVKLAAPDGNILELLCFHSHPDKPQWEGMPYSTGFTHIALTVESLDVILKKFRERGMDYTTSPQLSPDGSVRVIYVPGPEKILLELVEELNS